MEGHLSYLKGCQQFEMGSTNPPKNTQFEFKLSAENPLAYTKLFCFLPWIATQFGLTFASGPEADEACLVGSGEKPASKSTHQDNAQFFPLTPNKEDVPCKEAFGLLPDLQFPCIFPFRYGDVTYNSCTTLETSDFIVPVWRCPVFNSTKKYTDDKGVEMNWFPEEDADTAEGYCLDVENALEKLTGSGEIELLVNPDKEECHPLTRIHPFSTCRNECPGGKANVLHLFHLCISLCFYLFSERHRCDCWRCHLVRWIRLDWHQQPASYPGFGHCALHCACICMFVVCVHPVSVSFDTICI